MVTSYSLAAGGAVQSGGAVKAFNAKGLADITQGELKHLEETAKSLERKDSPSSSPKEANGNLPSLNSFPMRNRKLSRPNLKWEMVTSYSLLPVAGRAPVTFWAVSVWKPPPCSKNADSNFAHSIKRIGWLICGCVLRSIVA